MNNKERTRKQVLNLAGQLHKLASVFYENQGRGVLCTNTVALNAHASERSIVPWVYLTPAMLAELQEATDGGFDDVVRLMMVYTPPMQFVVCVLEQFENGDVEVYVYRLAAAVLSTGTEEVQ